MDAAGQAYVTGWTYSPDFPTTRGAYDRTDNGHADVFVTKLNAAGSRLVYSTYLGGTYQDEGYSIAVDAAGQAYVTGRALSWDFPTTRKVFDRTCGKDGNCDATDEASFNDAFLTKLNAAGSALVYSTYLGGRFGDAGMGVTVDAAGQAYILGDTTSDDLPTRPGALHDTKQECFTIACGEPFLTKLNAAGSALAYSTYLGLGTTTGYGIALDAARHVYVTGSTFDRSAFPPKPGTLDPTFNGEGDAFVAKIVEGKGGTANDPCHESHDGETVRRPGTVRAQHPCREGACGW